MQKLIVITRELIHLNFKQAYEAFHCKCNCWRHGGKAFVLLFALTVTAQAEPHHMQHGFILAPSGTFTSHLVADGHHSWQSDLTGQLSIEDPKEQAIYEERKALNKEGGNYFLLLAQAVDLPSLQEGQVLSGPIVEAKVGDFQPKNIIVKKATFKVDRILLNLANPFFANP